MTGARGRLPRRLSCPRRYAQGVLRREADACVHRIVDRPEHHEAPGAWEWDRSSRQQRDAVASRAARRFLEVEPTAGEGCWRCEAAPAASPVGLCTPCLTELRST